MRTENFPYKWFHIIRVAVIEKSECHFFVVIKVSIQFKNFTKFLGSYVWKNHRMYIHKVN